MSYTITNITQATNAVVTTSATGSNPFAVGGYLGFAGVVGMTQINGQNGVCIATGGTSGAFTATVNINTSAYTAYSSGGTVTLLNGLAISNLPTGNPITATDVFPWDQGTTTIQQSASAIPVFINPVIAAETNASLTPTNYSYFPGYGARYTFPVVGATNQQFQNGGAIVHRFNDRVMIGDAATNDSNYPNTTKDWLSAFQTSTAYGDSPISNGTLIGCQMACLANHLVGGLGGAALFGAESVNQGSGGGDIIVTNSFAINNNPTGITNAWAWYSESWRCNNTTGQTVGMEIDVVQQGELAQATPYAQSPQEATGFITAAGAGRYIAVTLTAGTPGVVTWPNHGLSANAPVWLSSTYIGGTLPASVTTGRQYYVSAVLSANTFSISSSVAGAAIAFATNSTGTIAAANQYPATVAWGIGANPVPWDKGIIFSSDSINGTDGNDLGFGYAINLAKGHLVQWWANGGVPTGSVTCVGTTTANSTELQFGEGYAAIYAQDGLPHTYFRGTSGAVNYLNIYHSSTGNPVTLSAGGSDTNIDLALVPQGSGDVKFGTYAAATISQVGYVTIKDSTGTPRRLLVG